MLQRPLVLLVVALILGILLANHYPIDPSTAILTALLACVIAGIGILRAWRYNAWALFGVCILVGLVLTSSQRVSVQSPIITFNGKSVTVSGTVVDRPDVRAEGTFYKVALSSLQEKGKNRPIPGVIRVKVSGNGKIFAYGDVLALRGKVGVPEPPGNPGAFDYRQWLNRQGIAATLYVQDSQQVHYLGRAGSPLHRMAYSLRDGLEKIFDQTMSPNQAVILNGLIFGTRGEIPPDVQQAFNETGLVHILSVSGYHVALVVALVLALLRLFRVPTHLTAWVAIPVLLFYAIMTGLGPAVLRSTLMAILLLLAQHLGRPQDWPTTLAVAAGVILVQNPLTLYDIGFQLSFVATWGLLYLTSRLNALLPNLPRSIALLITVPLAAQLATLPLVLLYFNLVSPVSILANLLTTHLVALVMLFGGLGLLGGVLYLPLGIFINTSTGLLTDLFLWLVTFCAALPGSARYFATPSLLMVTGYYLVLLAVCQLVQRPELRASLLLRLSQVLPERTATRFATGCLIFLLILLIFLSWPVSNQLKVHFIDVGQGDSALIQTPNQRNILVDTGGWQRELQTGRGAGDYVIVPYLHRLGLNDLDVLILTHPHADHIGGARAVLRNFPVKLVVVTPYGLQEGDQFDEGYDILLQEIRAKGISLKSAKVGDELRVDDTVPITFLGPTEKYSGTRSDANNNSLVFKLNYQNRTILFTGDIEAEAEGELLDNQALTSEILKVPHHGSGYFHQDFFSNIRPKLSVISVGANNRFNHPAPRTIEALQQIQSQILRTDRHGAIILTTDGAKWEVETGRGSK